MPGCLPAKQGVNTFRRPRLLPRGLAPRRPPPPPHSPRQAEQRGSRRRARIPREPGAGPRRSVVPQSAHRRQTCRGGGQMNSREENPGRCGGGGRPPGSTRLQPAPPPHLCGHPRAPRGGAAVTSLHKPGPPGREGAAGTRAVSPGPGRAGHESQAPRGRGPASLPCGGGRCASVCFG